MSGRPELNDRQKQKLIKFRENLQDVLEAKHDDYYLTRFLRARSFDLAKSEEMLRNEIKWRAQNKIDRLRQDFKIPEVCEKYWAGGILDGFDKEDCPIWVIPIGNFDPKGLLSSCKTSDMVNVTLFMLEQQYEQFAIRTKQLGKRIAQMTLIVDLENLGLQHLWKPGIDCFTQMLVIMEKNYPDSIRRIIIVRAPSIFPVAYELAKPFLQEYTRRKIQVCGQMEVLLSLMEHNYPETLKSILVVKAPTIFPIAYQLCKPFLQEHTRKKIKVLGSNWKDVLLKYVDPDVLPVYWGGSKKDPDGDPMCQSLIKLGGQVPKSYYRTEFDTTQKGMVTKDISRAGALELKYNVHKPSSVLRYTFKTYGNDIGFGVTLDEGTSKKPTVILESKRINSHLVPEDGELILETPGTYTVKFDNSYSWTKGKTVSYLLEVLEPTDEDPGIEEQMEEVDLNN